MKYTEIARQLGTTENAVKILASKALRKIEQAGDMETFATVVRLTQLRSAGAYIPCGSVECLPEWRQPYRPEK